jgi:type II secretory ATPase GspE/PulE/Tfp pilus assembly ATPase PilB-like protein
MPVRRDITLAEDTAPFSEAMRVLMRADPDTIMVGEIRDKDTAEVFAPAVQSGHRVLTTVHAASAIGIIDRLSSAPILMPRSVLAGKRFISALVYQSLLPTLCPRCSLSATTIMPAERLHLMEKKFQVSVDRVQVVNERGCSHCHGGRYGQTVAAEIILPDSETLRLFRDGLDVEAERRWRQTRSSGFDDSDMTGKTAFEHGLYKCLQGRIDPRDLEHAFESLRTYEVVDKAC